MVSNEENWRVVYGWLMNRCQHTRGINGYKLKNHYEYGMN